MKRKILIIGTVLIGVLVLLSFFGPKDNIVEQAGMGVPTVPVNASEVLQKGNRQIAVDVGEAATIDYEEAFKIAQKVGLERVGIMLAWFILEPTPGNYDGAWLELANSYYPSKNVAVDLTVAVFNANQKVTAGDLKDKPMNDPEVIARFKKLLDFIFSKTKDTNFPSINIGSEQDIYFQTDAKQWREFTDFYKQIAKYIHEQKPGVPVTSEFTFEGLTDGGTAQFAKEVNKFSDQIGISYYPMDKDGFAADPKRVHDDFAQITKLYPDKPILFFQFGYPSSEYLQSSPEKQAQFIHESFKAWDKYASRIKLIDFTWLHGFTEQGLQETIDFYGNSDKKFSEFLNTLNLRTYSGQDKPAFVQLRAETSARGWGQ